MMIRNLLLAAAVCLAPAAAAHATILTFDQNVPSNFEAVDQNYGDRVTSILMPGNYGYGVGSEGFTPNIVVSYGPPSADANLWTTGYGDLVNILFKDADGFDTLEVTLTADPGYLVNLYSWDMAAYSSAFSSDPSIAGLTVRDGNGNILYSATAPQRVISESTHTSYDFSANPLSAPVLILAFDSGNLGGLSDDIAFDNIRFGQTLIPEPASISLLGLAALALLRRRR